MSETVEVEDIIDMTEIADMLGVKLSAVRSYRARGRLPEPVLVLGIGPIWRRSDIIEWQATRPGKAWRRGKTGVAA